MSQTGVFGAFHNFQVIVAPVPTCSKTCWRRQINNMQKFTKVNKADADQLVVVPFQLSFVNVYYSDPECDSLLSLSKVFETRNADDLTEEWLKSQLSLFRWLRISHISTQYQTFSLWDTPFDFIFKLLCISLQLNNVPPHLFASFVSTLIILNKPPITSDKRLN